MRQEMVRTPHGSDGYLFMEAGEILGVAREQNMDASLDWSGDTRETFLRKVELGDESMVAESEKFLAMIEDQVPMSRGWRNVDDVVGAVPNVPAFLAGHPQHMRRRERTMRNTAPLAIYMDLTSSGDISERDVCKRGVVLLALTRMLVEHRAVELWVGASLGMAGRAGTVAWRVDTAPLDLARSGYHVAATAMSRMFGYHMCRKTFATSGGWPFDNYDLHRRTALTRMQAVLGNGGELMYVPPIYMSDPMTRDPVGWLKGVMAEYVGDTE